MNMRIFSVVERLWFRVIVILSEFVQDLKEHLLTASLLCSLVISLLVFVSEIVLAMVSLPMYVFYRPTKLAYFFNERGCSYSTYKLRRIYSLTGSALVVLFFIFRFFIADDIQASSPPVVNFGTTTLFSQSDWSGGVGSSTSTQYTSGTNLDTSTAGQFNATSTVTSTQGNWYNSSWNRRRSITIDASRVSSTESNFPILITEANFDANLFNNLRSDGLDLIFTASDGTTLLDREIAAVSTTAQTLEVWVRIPSLSGTTDTQIYAYYGNSGTSVANATTTWDSSIFNFVAHLNEDPSVASNPIDSLNGASGSYTNTPTATSGPFGDAVQFNGTNQYISFTDASYLDLGDNHAYSIWVNPNSFAASSRPLNKSNTPNHWQNAYEIGLLDTGVYEFYSYTDGGQYPGASSAAVASNGTWNKVAASFDRGNDLGTIIVDGVAVTSDISGDTGSPVNTTEPLFIGSGSASSEFFNGSVDEVRLYGVTVSTSWFATEYNNQSSPGTFYSVASEEVYWYSSSWSYRREIQVDPSQVSTTQANFPMLVTGYGLDSNFWNNINSDGSDILFTQDDGATVLARELVSVSTSAQTMEAYVSIPSLSDTSTTTVYMYYGNSSASETNSSSVWSNYAAVWHFEEDPSVSTDGDCGGGSNEVCDSSGNGNHANATNANFSSSNLVSGQIGRALQFIENPGSAGQVLDVTANASINNLTNLSVTFWLQGDSTPQSDPYFGRLVTKTIGGSCSGGWEIIYDDDANAYIAWDNQPAISNPVFTWARYASSTSAEAITDDTDFTPRTDWHHVALTFAGDSSDSGSFYIDGGSVSGYLSTSAQVGALNDDSACDLRFGAQGTDTARQLDATLDEFRIYPQTVSSSYILTEYNNHTNTSSFYSMGSHTGLFTSGDFATGTLVSAIFDVGTDVTAWGTLHWTSTDDTNTIVKVRTSNDSGMSGATAFDSCTAFSQDDDITSNSCVTDGERYMQYQIELTTSTATFQDITVQTLYTATATIAEAGGSADITFSLDEVSGVDVTVPFTVGGTATTGTDHDLFSGSIVIPAGQLTAVTTTNITDDLINEGDETVILTLGSPTNGVAGNQSVYSLTIQDDDYAGVSVTTSSLAITEGSTTATYTIALTIQPTSTVTIALSTSTDSQSTLSTSSIDFTTTTWNTPVTVTITAVDDSIAEGTHTAVITHSVSQGLGGAYDGYSVTSVTSTVTDNDNVGVTVTTSSLALAEGGTTATYTIQLDSQPTTTVTIGLSTSTDSQATLSTSSIDFTSSTWNTPVTVTVTAVDDALAEGTHSAVVTHSSSQSNGQYDNLSISNVTFSVTDNETASVTITTSTVAISEAGTTATYTIALSSAPTSSVVVDIRADSQATTSQWFAVFTSSTWNSPQTITVTAVDDAISEGTHSTNITHTVTQPTGGNYDGVSADTVTMTITDNDSLGVNVTTSSLAISEAGTTATYTIALTSAPTTTVTITLSTSTDSQISLSTSSIDFTSSNYSTPVTVTITAVDENISEGTHSGVITHSASQSGGPYDGIAVATVTTTITDNDAATITITTTTLAVSEAGVTASYTLQLDSQPTSTVTITLSTSTNGVDVSPASLSFTSVTWNTPQTITVTAVDDAVQEGAHNSAVSHTVSNSGGVYDGVSISDLTFTITDNDSVGVSVDVSTLSLTEGGSAGSYTIVLNTAPSANVDITLATSTSQVSLSTTSILFTTSNWNSVQTITVTPVDDDIADGTATSVISHVASSGDGNYDGISINSVTTTVADNDTAGVTVSESSLSIAEGGSADTYNVVLTSEPTASVIIALTTSTSAFTVSTSSLTFTASNWNTPQTVTVTPPSDDSVAESTVVSSITHAATSGDSSYNGASVGSVSVTLTDDDSAAVSLSETALTFTEGATDTYTIALSTAPSSTVTIALATSSTDVSISTTSVTFTAANYSTPVTVTVSSTDNSTVDGTRTVTITHTATSADTTYDAISISDVTVSVGDNDTATVTEDGGSPTFAVISIPTSVNTTPSGETSSQNQNITCPLTPGAAYKGDANSAVYLVTNVCTLRPFQNSEAYFSYFDDWSNVIILPQSEIDNTPNDPVDFVPAGPKYDPKYGALVKTVNDPRVYLLLGTERYWINSETVFESLNYNWDWIEDVSPELLNQYTEGEEITYTDHHPNYTLIKYPNDPKVYRLEPDPTDATKQVKRHIINDVVFEDFGFRFDRIVTISPSETYPDGNPIGQ